MSRVLLVDDEPHMLSILTATLAQDAHETKTALGVDAATALLASGQFDCVITDQCMADGTGAELLKVSSYFDPCLAVIFLTAMPSLELAVDCMRNGAFDFLAKPFDPEVLRAAVKRACQHTALLRENALLRQTVVQLEGTNEIPGDTPAIRTVREMIQRVAATNATVLISGETGTGKELVARAIYKASARRTGPFLVVNCAAFTETLLESELFGHERGAFTGADRPREGLFEAAHNGTLFLDEIGEMSLTAQAKLLRVITDGLVTRVGSTRPREVSVRVIVATHRDLQACVKEGSFREDLFYRLNVFPIWLPPLRSRMEDLPLLCDVLLRQIGRDLKLPARNIRADAMALLKAYRFPGNIRELRNLLERASILANGSELGPEHFPGTQPDVTEEHSKIDLTSPAIVNWDGMTPINMRSLIADVERGLIEKAIEASEGIRAEAARRLGLSRSDLSYKVSKHQAAAVGSVEVEQT